MHFARIFAVTVTEVTAEIKRARGRAQKSKKIFLKDFQKRRKFKMPTSTMTGNDGGS